MGQWSRQGVGTVSGSVPLRSSSGLSSVTRSFEMHVRHWLALAPTAQVRHVWWQEMQWPVLLATKPAGQAAMHWLKCQCGRVLELSQLRHTSAPGPLHVLQLEWHVAHDRSGLLYSPALQASEHEPLRKTGRIHGRFGEYVE